jgi:hypothetical protein
MSGSQPEDLGALPARPPTEPPTIPFRRLGGCQFHPSVAQKQSTRLITGRPRSVTSRRDFWLFRCSLGCNLFFHESYSLRRNEFRRAGF